MTLREAAQVVLNLWDQGQTLTAYTGEVARATNAFDALRAALERPNGRPNRIPISECNGPGDSASGHALELSRRALAEHRGCEAQDCSSCDQSEADSCLIMATIVRAALSATVSDPDHIDWHLDKFEEAVALMGSDTQPSASDRERAILFVQQYVIPWTYRYSTTHWTDHQEQIIELIAAALAAARRKGAQWGAEQMREAAAQWHDACAKWESDRASMAETNNANWHRKRATEHVRHAAAIRARPLPEPPND